jgi:hypothetical protein
LGVPEEGKPKIFSESPKAEEKPNVNIPVEQTPTNDIGMGKKFPIGITKRF